MSVEAAAARVFFCRNSMSVGLPVMLECSASGLPGGRQREKQTPVEQGA